MQVELSGVRILFELLGFLLSEPLPVSKNYAYELDGEEIPYWVSLGIQRRHEHWQK